jgi:general secretion pathway protein D
MKHSHVRIAVLILVAALVAGCAAGRAFRRGDSAARSGDWDTAVEAYRRAVQADPNSAQYKIALERAMISASLVHLDQARLYEARNMIEDALREYRRASEYDPPNRQIAAKVMELERSLRDQIEAAQPRPSIQTLREQARQAGPPPLFNLNTIVQPIRFNQASLRDILNAIGQATGINVTYDSAYQDRTYSVQLADVTLEDALNQVLTANQLFFKVVNQRTIMVIPDNPQKRAQYEEQVVRTFYISNVDPQELAQTLNTVIRIGGQQLPPVVAPNKTTNTITVRATTAVMAIIERIIEANDKPRAEVIVDVQILEVNRTRTKQFGLDLGDYAIGAVFSPEADPRGGGGGDNGATSSNTLSPRPFNANTITRGVSLSDFYLSVPSAVIRFLESDSETKVIAKPQLRGAEGNQLRLNLGEDVPVPSTTFTPVAQGGANFNPLTSFSYRTVGVIVQMTPRVTYEGDIRLELAVESSTLGSGITIAGQELPSFGSRKVETVLRLREGESSLLAGLLREDQRKLLTGFPTLLRLPGIRQLFSNNDSSASQTDIVMLLTPRIVRTHELSAQDLAPIFIGTQTNLGLNGPPPLIAPVGAEPAAPAGVPAAPAPAPQPPPGAAAAPGGGVPVVPPGSSNIPGTTAVQTAPVSPAPGAPPPAGAPVSPAAATGGQVLVSPPSTEFRVGGGPYTVPISIAGASQISSVSLTITYNPAAMRLRTVQEGSFMRAGGVSAAFTPQADTTSGRIDIAIVRTGDVTGVAGTGLLAALLFDTVGPGPANLTITGSAFTPGGAPVGLQFAPVAPVTVR